MSLRLLGWCACIVALTTRRLIWRWLEMDIEPEALSIGCVIGCVVEEQRGPFIHKHRDRRSGFAESLQQGQHTFEESRLDDALAEPAGFAAQADFEGVTPQKR